MKSLLKQLVKKWLQAIGEKLLGISTLKKIDEITSVNKGIQILLSLKYQELLRQNAPLPKLEDIEFRAFAQNGEDGILLYIFSLIGTTDKKLVDIGCGSCLVSNHANLIINHGWTGLLIDGNEGNIQAGREFYAKCPDTAVWPPKLIHAWVTKDNINSLLSTHSLQGEIDLLSLDIDGMDYWIWQAIECISPRVVVLEYMDVWGSNTSVTVPYQENFAGEYDEYGLYYGGASLSAFVKLAKEKGYRLVGCQRYGFNAFFIRSGIGEDIFPEIYPAECFYHPKAKYGVESRLAKAKEKQWIEV